MNGREVYRFATRVVPKSAQCVLSSCGVDISLVDLVVPHQANTRIIQAVARQLGVEWGAGFHQLEEYGNTSCASIPLCLQQARHKGCFRRSHDPSLGFRRGLSWGSVCCAGAPDRGKDFLMRVLLMFPGQGSQAVGYGRVATGSPACGPTVRAHRGRTWLGRASRLFRRAIRTAHRTDIAQPAIFVTSLATWIVLAEAIGVCVAGDTVGRDTDFHPTTARRRCHGGALVGRLQCSGGVWVSGVRRCAEGCGAARPGDAPAANSVPAV